MKLNEESSRELSEIIRVCESEFPNKDILKIKEEAGRIAFNSLPTSEGYSEEDW